MGLDKMDELQVYALVFHYLKVKLKTSLFDIFIFQITYHFSALLNQVLTNIKLKISLEMGEVKQRFWRPPSSLTF